MYLGGGGVIQSFQICKTGSEINYWILSLSISRRFLAALLFFLLNLTSSQKPKLHWSNWSRRVQLPVLPVASARVNTSYYHKNDPNRVKAKHMTTHLKMLLFLLCATSLTDSARELPICPFSRVGSVQLIQTEYFAFGMLSIA